MPAGRSCTLEGQVAIDPSVLGISARKRFDPSQGELRAFLQGLCSAIGLEAAHPTQIQPDRACAQTAVLTPDPDHLRTSRLGVSVIGMDMGPFLELPVMRGYHYLMRLAHLYNTLARFSKALAELFSALAVRAANGVIRTTLTGPWMDAEAI